MAPASKAAAGPARVPGRPRRPDVEDVVLGAALELLAERGLDGTTMSAVVTRSGVARATVYLRWPNRHALVIAAIRRAMGHPIVTGTGDAAADIRTGARQVQLILKQPLFRAVLSAIIEGVTSADPTSRLSYDAISPGSSLLAEDYERVAASQGYRTDLPARLVIDTTTGALLGFYFSTGRPPTDGERDAIVEVILNGLRVRPAG